VQKQESVLFAVNKSIVRGAEETKLVRWYHGLSATTRRKITEGEEPITMQGRASATGDPQKNRELSDDRRAAVERILRQIAGSRALIHTSAVGAYETLQPGERDEERAVIVSVMDTFEGSGDAAGTP
jgi:outer membrane protein OmpA-like peptidoglycan-associated protein